jgi:CheY-like chemotaxis protein
MHVLIADDDRDSTHLLALIVQAEFPDATVDVAYDGKQALDLATARRPDFAVIDLEMPHMGGEESARAISELYAGDVPYLIALSGNVMRLSSLQGTGVFHDVQAKPCQVDKLLSAFKR